MLIETILMIITLITLIVASYSDLKWREVPDWLSYGLIFSALSIRTIFSFNANDGTILVSGLLGFSVFFLLACVLYYSNQWGGGDSKLLMGMGAVIGITYPFSDTSWNLFWFFLAILGLGAIYGLAWITGLAIKEGKKFKIEFLKGLSEQRKIHLVLGIVSLILLLGFLVGLKYGLGFVWPIVIFPLAAFYLFLFVTTVENSCFVLKRKIEHLTEGDWLAEEVKLNGKTLFKKKTLEKEDLEELSRLHKEGSIDQVTIKEGIPFVPSFLLGYIALILLPSILPFFGV